MWWSAEVITLTTSTVFFVVLLLPLPVLVLRVRRIWTTWAAPGRARGGPPSRALHGLTEVLRSTLRGHLHELGLAADG